MRVIFIYSLFFIPRIIYLFFPPYSFPREEEVNVTALMGNSRFMNLLKITKFAST